MAHVVKDNSYDTVMELLIEKGTGAFREAFELLLNEAMQIERSEHLNAAPYERTEDRRGHANGYKPKKLKSTLGELALQVPQVRDSDFYPSCLEKGSRSDRAFLVTLAEMYINGVSTRKVTNILEELCGLSISSTDVSRATQKLDTHFEDWRTRKIGKMHCLYIDARYEKVRHGGHVVDCAVLVAVGITPSGHREVLGVSVSLSEHEVHWRDFFNSLIERGLHGLELIISDAHAGLKAARKSCFPGVKWQRCQFHLQQNAQGYVPKKSMKEEVASSIRGIFNAEDGDTANLLLKKSVEHYRESAPVLSEWMEANIPDGLTVFAFKANLRKRLRTTNMLERINQEIKRRTRVARLFPNEASCLRLTTAVLMEISEDWGHGRCYLTWSE